jgi:hypothetical protein
MGLFSSATRSAPCLGAGPLEVLAAWRPSNVFADVGHDEIVALIGERAGKTTLFACIAGLSRLMPAACGFSTDVTGWRASLSAPGLPHLPITSRLPASASGECDGRRLPYHRAEAQSGQRRWHGGSAWAPLARAVLTLAGRKRLELARAGHATATALLDEVGRAQSIRGRSRRDGARDP